VGAYHLCYPALNPNPASEWAYFSAAIQGSTLDLPPMLDDEEIGGLSWAALRTWVLGFLSLVGPSALHYCNQNYLANLNAAGGIPYRQWTARPGATSLATGDIATQYGSGPIAGSQSVDQDYFDQSFLRETEMAILHETDGDGAQYIMPEGTHLDGAQSQAYVAAGVPMVNLPTAEVTPLLGNSNASGQAAVAALAAQVTALAAQVASLQAALDALPAPATPAAVQAVQEAVEALPVPAGPAALAAVGTGVAALQAAVAKLPTTDPPASGTGKVALTFSGTYKGGKTSGTATGTVS
jgi:hypothetical protein